MAECWDDAAANWDTQISNQEIAEKAFESLQCLINIRGLHILDFGCGTGLLSQKLSPLVKDIVALDSSEAMIEQLDRKQLTNVEPVVDILSRGLVAMHPAFRAQFDLIVASRVCHGLASYSDAADIIFSLLEKDGYFVHWDWLFDDKQMNGMSKSQVQQVLSSVGFSDVEVTTPFAIETDQGVGKILMAVAQK